MLFIWIKKQRNFPDVVLSIKCTIYIIFLSRYILICFHGDNFLLKFKAGFSILHKPFIPSPLVLTLIHTDYNYFQVYFCHFLHYVTICDMFIGSTE